ncbi:MAG: Ig-like domain-containing protein [Clostridium sp.]|uniref:Ig-like domain-containing protein n=1 Tax=Clostridium sp. TaxID=1506 RepID=UPI0025BC6537|nr:Ig-like domain-containing protein [Clostridium sp.]MCE5221064.1 Ig-like domain-containing protein [Clostridium sp.]
MKRTVKQNKKIISIFLVVMMIWSMGFTGIKVSAATTGLTIGVNDSSNQSIPKYTNNGGTRSDNIFSNPVRLAANATAKISYNFTNATMAKYQFVQAGNLTTVPQFPQDSTMTNINLPAPNSHDAYANDIGDRGTISTMQYVYAGNPSTASSTAQLSRDVSFGTPLSSTMLVQNATVDSDIPNYTLPGSNAFLSNQTIYSDKTTNKTTKTSTYYVWNPWSNAYSKPTKNAAWKAMKFWGYFSPSQSGYYNLGAYSDDGAYGYLIVNGETKEFVNDWSIKSAFNRTKNNPIYLTANSYYPIYMEWYEGCPTEGAFTPVYQFSSQSSSDALNNSWSNVPQNYFYSSKTTTPGTIPGAYFGDVSGIPFPTQDGIYYIATKFVSGEGTTSGLYGPFIIDKTPPTISNLSVVSDYSMDNKKADLGNTLTITFKASETLQANPQILLDGYVTNPTSYTKTSDNNYTATVKIAADGSINSSGDKITQTGPINVQIANYSDLSGNVGLPVQDSSVTFINKTDITLTLTQNPMPTVLTNGNVTITANASASGYGNSIKTIKYATGNRSINYFTAGGTSIYDSSISGSKSTVQSTFNVNTNGVYTVYATDNSGNVAVQTIDVENIYATPPVITAPINGTITNNNKPTIKGTGEAGATVTVYDNGTAIGTALVQSDGTWSLTLTTALSDGTHPITAKQQNLAGNISAVSNTVNLTIDTVAPAAPVIIGNPSNGTITNDKVTITINYSIDSAIKEYRIDGGEWQAYNGSFDVTENCTIYARGTDAAGNKSEIESYSVTNIYVPSIISAHGLYNGNGTNITEEKDLKDANGNPVTNGIPVTDKIPVTLAMIVEANSSNPAINLSTDTSRIKQGTIEFKMYKISDSDNDTIDTNVSPTVVTLNNTGKINLTGLTMESGHKYLIVYTVTPYKTTQDKIEKVKVTAKADEDEINSKPVNLNILVQPDLF